MPRHYRCQNSLCRAEMEFIRSSPVANCNPRCSCGAEMKRLYVKPGVEKLDFAPEASLVEAQAKKKHARA